MIVAISFISIVALLVVGCGGGGGGGTGGTTATNSTASNVGGNSGSNSGSGLVPPNVILFTDTPDSGATLDLQYITPSGGSETLVASEGPTFEGWSENPASKNQQVFGYAPAASGGLFGIYANTKLSAVGATTIVAPAYAAILSIQVSDDGKFVYFVAAQGLNASQLFKVAIGGGVVTTLDFAFTAHVRQAGDMVVYDKFPNGLTTDAIFTLPTSGAGSPTELTNDPANDYANPQWSKDGSSIVLVSDKTDAQYEVYTMAATPGASLTQVTSDPVVNKNNGVTFSADGTKTAFIGLNTTNSAKNGVYLSGVIGQPPSDSLLFPDQNVLFGIYWSGANAFARGGFASAYLARRKHHGLLP